VYVLVVVILILLARSRFREVKGAPLAREQARLTSSALGFDRAKNGAAADAAGPP